MRSLLFFSRSKEASTWRFCLSMPTWRICCRNKMLLINTTCVLYHQYCTTNHQTRKTIHIRLNGQQATQRNCLSVIPRWCDVIQLSNVWKYFRYFLLDLSWLQSRDHLTAPKYVLRCNIGLSLTIDTLTRGQLLFRRLILHVANWCFLFLVGRVWISFLLKMRHCVF